MTCNVSGEKGEESTRINEITKVEGAERIALRLFVTEAVASVEAEAVSSLASNGGMRDKEEREKKVEKSM